MYLCDKIFNNPGCVMSKKLIKTIVLFAVCIVLGIIIGTGIGILKIIFPEYSEMISRMTKIICILAICLIFLISFVSVAILTFKQFKFQQFIIDELNNIGFSEKLHDELVKNLKKNSKNKEGTNYLLCLNYLAIEKNFHNDHSGVIELLEEVDLEKLSRSLRIDSGKAPQNSTTLFANFCDVLFNAYYRLGMKDEAEKLYRIFDVTYKNYISKYKMLDGVLYESRFMYLLIIGNIDEAKELMVLLKDLQTLEGTLSYKINTMEIKLLEGTLNEEVINQSFDECKQLIEEKSPIKAFHNQQNEKSKEFYLSKLV